MEIHDILTQQEEIKKYATEFILWPDAWSRFSSPHSRQWAMVRLERNQRVRVPNDPGVYTLLVQPGIANHPACSFLMYVGQAVSLCRRFSEYLGAERKASGRPKVLRLLHRYDPHVWFCFTKVAAKHLDLTEDALISAYLPPCNEEVPAEVRKGRNAF